MSNVTALPREARPIEAPAVEGIPLHDLYLSDMNPRQEADPEGIALLADSIAIIGLIQPIAGFRDGQGKVGIVAGGRRWRAIKLAIERDPELTAHRPELAFIPTRLAPDAATARAWAAVENTAREDLHPADEIRAFGRMREGGADVPTIARTFGITEAHVYRRLALAALPAPVLDALKAGEITLGAAKAFTVAEDEALTLTVLDQIRGHEVSEHRIKQMLQPEAINGGTDRRARFVGLDAYEAAGGSLTRDLFSDTVALHDADLLQDLFTERLNAEAGKLAAGWKWAEVMADEYVSYSVTEKLARLYPVEGVLTEEQAERYDELAELANADALDEAGQAELEALDAIIKGDFTDAQRAVAGYYVYVSHSGTMQMSGPWVRTEDRAAAIEAGVLTGHAAGATGSDAAPAPKSPYSGALVEDMKAIRLAAIQTALLDKPEMVFDLLAFGLSLASGVSTSVFDLSPGRPNNCPSKTDGLEWSDRLAHPPAGHEAWSRPELRVKDLAQAFRDFTAAGKKARNAALVEGMARTLPYGAGDADFFALIEADSGASIRKVWTPTAENFFARVSADYLDALHLDLTGCDPQCNGFKAFKSQKKGEKAAGMERLFTDAAYQSAWKIDAEKKARIDAWVPDCF